MHWQNVMRRPDLVRTTRVGLTGRSEELKSEEVEISMGRRGAELERKNNV